MGRHRQQPQGAFLRDYRRRTSATRQREGRVGSNRVHHACAPERAAMTWMGPMAALREWSRRLPGTVRRSRTDGDLEEELRFHLDLTAAETRRRGGGAEDAERAATVQAGGLAQSTEGPPDQRGPREVGELARGGRSRDRMVVRNPGFTIL